MARNTSASPRYTGEKLSLSGIAGGNPPLGAVEMENFRIGRDGHPEKRWGYTPTLLLPGKPRALYSGYVKGLWERVFLIGSGVYRETADHFPGYTHVGEIGSTDGDASFVTYLGELYLLDGQEIYLFTDRGIERAEGYIPLYGDGWDPIRRGEIREAENRLTPRIRIRYRNPEGEKNLYFGRRVLSVDRLIADGEEVDAESVTLIGDGYGCTAAAIETALEIEAVVTVEREEVSLPRSARAAFSFGRASDDSLFCYDALDPTVFLASRAVRPEAREESDGIGRTVGGGLYFPLGDPLYRLPAPITAVCRHNDRVLLFTAEGTWGVECDGDRYDVTCVHPSVGCDKRNAAIVSMNTPITYFGGKLMRFKEKLSGRSECNAEVISAPIADLVLALRDERVEMAYYPAEEEVWIAASGDDAGRVIVYRPDLEVFYTYTGVYLDRMLPAVDRVTFLSGEALYAMDEGTRRDCGDREIVARYRTGCLSFGDVGKRKRFLGFDGEIDPDGGDVTISVHADTREGAAFVVKGRARDGIPVYASGRRGLGRFRYLYCTMLCPGEARQRLCALSLYARV